ncbi:MAG: proline--tRNA ligase [Candidatus Hadarchaeales archaeon]
MRREKWKENFSEWFNEAIERAEIIETRYPVKGLYVWLPYGLKLRNNIFSILRKLMEDSGHKEVLFPLLIPEDLFRKEAEHIRGFEGQVYWVTRGGHNELDVKLALRPTSETSMYPMFSLWIRSHADLPLKVYQIVNIFRYETKMTKPLIRLREVTTFKEAHTAHATAEEAERQVKEAVQIYKRFFEELGVPFVITKRPPWDTFAGAVFSIAFDTLSPDGKTLQIGTVHNLGQNFAKVYGITYETLDGNHNYVYQTCYGISERAMAATIMVHGDDCGLCLPPNVAPVQVVIVPIYYKSNVRQVMDAAKSVYSELVKEGLRVHIDQRDLRPGNKFYYWERRGVPLRIEIGPEDIARSQLTLVPRHTGKRTTIPIKGAGERIKSVLSEMVKEMQDEAKKAFQESIHEVASLEDARKIIENRGGIVRMSWCGKEECGRKIEEATTCSLLGEEIDGKERPSSPCVVCSTHSTKQVLIAKTY